MTYFTWYIGQCNVKSIFASPPKPTNGGLICQLFYGHWRWSSINCSLGFTATYFLWDIGHWSWQQVTICIINGKWWPGCILGKTVRPVFTILCMMDPLKMVMKNFWDVGHCDLLCQISRSIQWKVNFYISSSTNKCRVDLSIVLWTLEVVFHKLLIRFYFDLFSLRYRSLKLATGHYMHYQW